MILGLLTYESLSKRARSPKLNMLPNGERAFGKERCVMLIEMRSKYLYARNAVAIKRASSGKRRLLGYARITNAGELL